MKAYPEAEEKKRKRIMPGSSRSGGSSCAPPKYHMVYEVRATSQYEVSEYSYHQGIHSFLEAQLQGTLGLCVLCPKQFYDR
jgi:hypothetical protein